MRAWCRRAAVGFVAVAGGVGTAVALAAGPPLTSGTLTINGDQAGAGFAPSVAMRADGRFAVAYAQDPVAGLEELFVRRYGADDGPAASFQQAVPSDAARRYEPEYAIDPSTGAGVVVYQRNSGAEDTVWAQRLAENGTRVGDEIQVDADPDEDNQFFPKVVVAPGGAFVVTWRMNSGIIRLRRFSAEGVAPTGRVDVGVVRPSSSATPGYDVAMNAAGALVIVWAEQFFAEPSRLLARRFGADGGAAGGEFVAAELAPPATGQYLDPSVALADGGTAVVAFTETTGGAPRLLARRIGASGPLGAIVPVNEAALNDDFDPEIAMDGAGNAVVVWERRSTRSTLWAREFTPDLTPVDGESLVAGNLDVAGPRATVATRAGQRPVVAWATGGGIFARRVVFTPGGTPTTTTTTTETTPPPAPPAETTPPPAPPAGTTPALTIPAASTPVLPAQPPRAPLPAFTKAVTLPTTTRCVSRRSFRIRVKRLPGGTRIVRAEVRVNGKRVRVITGARLTAPVDLRGLPKGRFTVDLRVTTVDGRRISGKRSYRTCVPRRNGVSSGPL